MKKQLAIFLILFFILLISAVFYFIYKYNNAEFSPQVETKTEKEKINNLFQYKSLEEQILDEIDFSSLNEEQKKIYLEKIEQRKKLIFPLTPRIQEHKGYIIKLKNIEPTSSLVKQEASLEEIRENKEKIKREQDKIIDEVKRLDLNAKILNRFGNVYSGFSAEFDESYLEQIKTIPNIEIFPNLRVKANLMDSVPLINADDV